MTAMTLASALRTDGHEVGRCAWCDRSFAADLDHRGRPHAGRRYCSTVCRRFARNARRRPVRAHMRRWAHLIALHDAEQAGQTSLDPTPLPQVPTLEYAT